MDQRKSRRALIGVLLLGAVLLASPLLWQAWTTGHELDGKVAAFSAPTARAERDLLACLVQRPPQGLHLQIISANHFADPARGLVVRIERGSDGTRLTAWIAPGTALTAGEAAQLRGCAG